MPSSIATTINSVSTLLRRKLLNASSSSWPSIVGSFRVFRSAQQRVDLLQVGLAHLAGRLLELQLADDEAMARDRVRRLRRAERLDREQQVGHRVRAELLADARRRQRLGGGVDRDPARLDLADRGDDFAVVVE